VGVLRNGTNADIVTNIIGNAFLAQNQEGFIYDADGNQVRDGRWTNSWDAENRLLSMVSLASAPSGSKTRLTFQYDSKWRRISKMVESWNGSTWAVALSNKFVYDDWNLIAELNGTNNALIRSYTWGSDLSGTIQGAGGVGGLLAVTDATEGSFFVCFDGNGNLAALGSVDSRAISATYGYGPFAEPLEALGALRKMPIRFSTKYSDAECDLIHYGYRSYDPRIGRWNGRDPAKEVSFAGFLHEKRPSAVDRGSLYAFLGNAANTRIDFLGAFCIDPCGLAKAMGLDQGDEGGLICCDGSKYICVWKSSGSGRGRQIIEWKHWNQITCPTCSPYPTRPPYDPPISGVAAECEAFRTQVACLQNAFDNNECGDDPNCPGDIMKELSAINQKRNELNCPKETKKP
jgi:RHS repeat-associated protein